MIHTARTAIIIIASVCLLGTSIDQPVFAAASAPNTEVARAPSPGWIAATGNTAKANADPSTGYIGCPWLTTADLEAVWNLMTSQRVFSNYLISGDWDAREATGFCQVGGPPRGTKLVITVAVVSHKEAKQARQDAAERGDLFPGVHVDVVSDHPGVTVFEKISLVASPRVVLRLEWTAGIVIHHDRFRDAIKKVATRMAAHP